ncbi:MAG: S-methyl-5'-thioadenosine phosphorylase [Methanobacteriaceae archaeon]|nr:S-methyl-5'-thioadenosine phosphorylase [Methanobacteriaceae archaeon]
MIGIIGGTGVYDIANKADNEEKKIVKTEYGANPEVSILEIEGKKVAFLPRHSAGHSHPPHMINFKANISALKKLGVNQIIATNSVGSLNLDIGPGSIVAVDDFLDFTVLRDKTFYDNKVVHVDVTEPYCNRLREKIISNGDVVPYGTYVCTEGPRFETPAEIKMFQKFGGDVVGMTGLPEVVLAREKEICYSSICIVSNYGSGISPNKLNMDEVLEIMEKKNSELIKLIYNTIKDLDENFDCDCLHALNNAEI